MEVSDRSIALVSAPVTWRRTATLMTFAALALALGVLVYHTDRVTIHLPLLRAVAWPAGRHLFGAAGGSLPSFLHPFAFSLATAAAWRPGLSRRRAACAGWCAVNLAFEIGQHPAFKATWAQALRTSAGESAIVRAVLNYLLGGTFDVGDLAAVVLGALAAAAVLRAVDNREERCHATQ